LPEIGHFVLQGEKITNESISAEWIIELLVTEHHGEFQGNSFKD